MVGSVLHNLTATTSSKLKPSTPCQVPLIAIITKFDALVSKAYTELRNKGKSMREAQGLKVKAAQHILEEQFLKRLNNVTHPPAAIVSLGGQ